MNTRIIELRKQLGYSQERFGELLGITKSAVSGWESGRRKIPESSIKLICKEFNADYLWLTTGQGDMFSKSDDDLMDAIDKIMSSENEFLKDLFKAFVKLGDNEIAALEKLVDNLSEIRTKKS